MAACGAAADADILSHFKINSLLRSLPPTLRWTFDCNRFQQAVDCVVLDFLRPGRPSLQHDRYWPTPAHTPAPPASSQASIFGKLSPGWPKPGYTWTCPRSPTWSSETGAHSVPRARGRRTSIWPARSLFPGFVPLGDPVWAAGGDCASGSMVWPCVSHPPLSSHQTEGCIMAIILSHLDEASSPQSLTVTCLSDN